MTADPRDRISEISEIGDNRDVPDIASLLKLAMWRAFAIGVNGSAPAKGPQFVETETDRPTNPFHDMIH